MTLKTGLGVTQGYQKWYPIWHPRFPINVL